MTTEIKSPTYPGLYLMEQYQTGLKRKEKASSKMN